MPISPRPAVMSIEYTIDIQLTELGFPDILQPQTSVREVSRRSTPDGSFSSSHSPTSLSTTSKKRLLDTDLESADREKPGAKRTSNIEETTEDSTPPEALTCKPSNPAQIGQDDQTDKESAVSELFKPKGDNSTAGLKRTDGPDLLTGEKHDGDGDKAQQGSAEMQRDVEAVSDDSDVSDVYEDEEEEDEEEEGQDDDTGHSGDYRCSVCDLQLSSKFRLQDHMNLHTGTRPYCCAECGKRFCQNYSYRIHLRSHAQSKVDRLRCRICRRAFASQDDLTDHLSRTHFEKEFYECDQCKRVFTSLKACEYHVQLQKCMLDVVCEICGHSLSSSKSLARHGKVCFRKFKCTDCSKIFMKKNALLRHSFSHLGLAPYTCVRCRSHFRLAKLYRQHKCEPQRINCVACLREFLSQEDFQRHKKDTGCWGNQEPKGDEIRCLECGQRFDTKEELKKHAGAHQRVLKCAECGKGFRSALLLMSHMGGHAGQSPCLCQSCGLGFPHQQNYDSHLKTCGQTPQRTIAPKKRQASKSSTAEVQKLNAKPDPLSPAISGTIPASVTDSAAPPFKDFGSLEPVTERVTTGFGQSDGLWKLTLDKEPPPGVKLVLFLPVCPTRTRDLTLPSGIPQTLPVSAMQVQPQVSLSPGPSNGQLGVNPAFGGPLSTPLNLVSGVKLDPECEGPLDLSKKKSALSNILPFPVKSEPEDFEISAAGDDTERKADLATNPREANTDVKMNPMNLTTCGTTSSGLKIEVKKEPHSPGSDLNLWSSKTSELTEGVLKKEIKMEVE